MPLIKSKSKKAFSKNVSSEMHAGKPQRQALAIAYAVKRRAARKKYAEGGEVKKEDTYGKIGSNLAVPKERQGGFVFGGKPQPAPSSEPKKKMAYGGMVRPASMAEAIMLRRKAELMAEQGMDMDLDEMNCLAAEQELGEASDVEDFPQPMDSNEHDVDIESDEHDMVSAIRRKMKARRGA